MNSASCLLGEAEEVWNPFVSLSVHLFRGDTCALWSHGERLARGGGRGGDRKAPGSEHGSAVGQWVHDRGAVGSGPLQPGRGGPQAQVTAGYERLAHVFAFHLPIKWPRVAVFLRHVSLTILFHPRNLKTTGVRSCAYTCVHAVKARVRCQWFSFVILYLELWDKDPAFTWTSLTQLDWLANEPPLFLPAQN